jgi:hypothetical protein
MLSSSSGVVLANRVAKASNLPLIKMIPRCMNKQNDYRVVRRRAILFDSKRTDTDQHGKTSTVLLRPSAEGSHKTDRRCLTDNIISRPSRRI